MSTSSYSPWLHRFALLGAAATLLLLVAGGLVTSHGVGMAVPDWPNTYGYNMFLFPVSQWVGGVFYEHSHRLIAAAVGLLTSVLAAWLWARETRGRARWLGLAAFVMVLGLMGVRKLPVYVALAGLAPVVIVLGLVAFKRRPLELRWLGVVGLAAVILQGVLGGLRVVWLQDELGIFHATLAQLFFALMCALALLTSRWWILRAPGAPRPSDGGPAGAADGGGGLRGLVLATTLLILGQLMLGATMRHQHAGLAIPDFPLAYGKLWPAMDADAVARYNQQRLEVLAVNPITAFQIGLQMAHRLMAVLILAGVSLVAWRSRRREAAGNPPALRRLALIWPGMILAQIALGAWTLWSNKAADVATAHVLVGALSLVTGALWLVISFARPATSFGCKSVSASAPALGPGGWEAPMRAAAGQ
jgi:cytochrome c oxidase assembly protein subunit 15